MIPPSMQMQTIAGISAFICSLFLFLWYRTLVSLPDAARPGFAHRSAFKWGAPGFGLLLFLLGCWLLVRVRISLSLAALGAAALAAFILIYFDRYTAQMRIIYDRYRSIRASDPSLDETTALYRTVRWRYPDWQHDRLVEMVGGKDIESLILFMIVQENRIHPIRDWELYRKLKKKASRVVTRKSGKRGGM